MRLPAGRRRGATAFAFVAGAALIVMALIWVVGDQRRATACARWQTDYEAAVKKTSEAIKGGDEGKSGSAFERLYLLDDARPGGCSLPVDPNLRLRCLRCGHE